MILQETGKRQGTFLCTVTTASYETRWLCSLFTIIISRNCQKVNKKPRKSIQNQNKLSKTNKKQGTKIVPLPKPVKTPYNIYCVLCTVHCALPKATPFYQGLPQTFPSPPWSVWCGYGQLPPCGGLGSGWRNTPWRSCS